MADMASRIEQFRKMANDDPKNELGHFSLGKALMENGQFDEAAASFRRCLELNPNISKSYQLLGATLLKLNQKEEAIKVLTAGATRADERREMMPRNEMAKMLKDLDAPVPQFSQAVSEKPVAEGEVLCQRCNKIARRMSAPPFRNAIGQEIYQKICADCFREWIGMGTKVINELRLPLNDPQAQKVYDQHMMEFLNLR
ncbi:MAG TPA: Fe(2+)-trafficking protein [Tepidisphaeraceae bacterium]|jgi:Fe-S cluster biosynthesis and repair protein YggX|nr:Fe(2+)-trafficking protein [Tepidisphaeraceae bacterium]